MAGPSSPKVWTFEENKLFETALVKYGENTSNRWQKIAEAVGGNKTAEDVKKHYELLEHDINAIVSGKVPLPNYISNTESSSEGSN
ncbi:SANT/Myb domain [Macleaya cordata]|uniref:SANT/Myb domain n=1 Tax=Macleaya cordata TaxID=56857 RepID=A0A200Q9B2_MACCD|nr:SANT/Myb domain [Macleaya cordata]